MTTPAAEPTEPRAETINASEKPAEAAADVVAETAPRKRPRFVREQDEQPEVKAEGATEEVSAGAASLRPLATHTREEETEMSKKQATARAEAPEAGHEFVTAEEHTVSHFHEL